MRRLLLSLLVVTVLMVVLGAAGCGGGAQTAGLAQADSSDLSPEAILTAAVAASEDMASAQGSFEFTISFDVDTSQLPEEALGLFGQPMTMAGTFAYGSDPQAVDFAISADLFGQAMDMGMKLLEDQAWFRFLDQWYEAPAEMQGLMGDPAAQETQAAELQKMLTDAGIDPMTWMKDLRVVGEETLDGIPVYHLAASPDIAKMMTDLIALMQSEQFMGLLDPTGSTGDLMGAGMLMPGTEELQEMQTQLASMFEDLTADLWIAKEDSVLRKAAIGARMVPPAGEDAEGLNAIDLVATMLFQEVNQPVTVEPPASALPWSEFEKAMQENPEMFMGGLMGALGGAATPTY
jgi:hypothetical protein